MKLPKFLKYHEFWEMNIHLRRGTLPKILAQRLGQAFCSMIFFELDDHLEVEVPVCLLSLFIDDL